MEENTDFVYADQGGVITGEHGSQISCSSYFHMEEILEVEYFTTSK